MSKKHPDIFIFILMGGILGIGTVILSYFGNPANTGLCISCFMENIAGSLSLHDNIRMQYIRPEIIGLVLGSFAVSLKSKEFTSSGGSSPLLRFLVGILLIIGCSVFIGCPVKLILKIAAGDVSALIGLAGLIAGVYIGLEFIDHGFRLGEAKKLPLANGLIIPAFMILLLIFLLVQPAMIQTSLKGAGAMHAPLFLSLGLGLLIGGMAQRSQFCISGGFARIFLWGPKEIINCPRSTGLLISIASFLGFAFLANIFTGQFSLGLQGQPSSNPNYAWSFLGMLLVGFGSVLIKGCPLRQLIMAGQGDNDAGAAVLGMLVGAALVQNWNLRADAAGTPAAAQIGMLIGFLLLFSICLLNRRRGYGIAPEFQTGLD